MRGEVEQVKLYKMKYILNKIEYTKLDIKGYHYSEKGFIKYKKYKEYLGKEIINIYYLKIFFWWIPIFIEKK